MTGAGGCEGGTALGPPAVTAMRCRQWPESAADPFPDCPPPGWLELGWLPAGWLVSAPLPDANVVLAKFQML